jgi:spermidine synthase
MRSHVARVALAVALVPACRGPTDRATTEGQPPVLAPEEQAPARDTSVVPVSDRPAIETPPGPVEVDGSRVLDEAESDFSRIRVRQHGHVRTLAFVGAHDREAIQSGIDVREPDRLYYGYSEAMFVTHAVVPKVERVLIVGLGGGSMVRFLRRHFPEGEVDAVEIDPEVIRMAEKWFGVRPGARTRIIEADGIEFMARSQERWDVIYMDVFWAADAKRTDASGIPTRFKTLGFLRSLIPRLRPGGVVALNLHHKSSFPKHMALLREVFTSVATFKVPRDTNRVVLTSPEANAFDAADSMLSAAKDLDQRKDFGFSLAKIVKMRVPDPG